MMNDRRKSLQAGPHGADAQDLTAGVALGVGLRRRAAAFGSALTVRG